MNEKHACGLALPRLGADADADPAATARALAASRALAAAPMDNFLRRAGFPEPLVPALVREYEAGFAAAFPVAPFRGVPALLRELTQLRRLNEQAAAGSPSGSESGPGAGPGPAQAQAQAQAKAQAQAQAQGKRA